MPEDQILLGVNIDHCATLRQARYRDYSSDCGGILEPDPVAYALAAEMAGADGITVHLREDRRHIQERDVRRLREAIRTHLNLEMAGTEAMVAYALELKPDYVCLVPESRDEVTTEGGLNVFGQKERISRVVKQLSDAGIVVSLFIDPTSEQVQASAEVGAPMIELHTGAFANAWHDSQERDALFDQLVDAAVEATDAGLIVNAGHGINYHNIRHIRQIPELHELNIGHSIISRSLFTGVQEAVRTMKVLMQSGVI